MVLDPVENLLETFPSPLCGPVTEYMFQPQDLEPKKSPIF